MKYDFTTIIDRKGKDAMALDAVGSHKGHVKKLEEENMKEAQ